MATGSEVIGLQEPCLAGCVLQEVRGPCWRAVPSIYEGLPQGRSHNATAGGDDDDAVKRGWCAHRAFYVVFGHVKLLNVKIGITSIVKTLNQKVKGK